MSLTLKESCQMYERYCRRNADTPTFEAFNAKHFTCLPRDADIYNNFKSVLTSARRSAGLPVTRRLPSLWHRFAGEEKVVAVPPPVVQVKTSEKAFVGHDFESALRNNVRAPPLQAMKDEEPTTWTLEAYKEAVQNSRSVLLKEHKNLIVHLVPEERSMALESLACKLTKTTWETLRGKSAAPLKMRDGSMLSVESLALDESDLAEFVRNRKKKIGGPYFIRFSRI